MVALMRQPRRQVSRAISLPIATGGWDASAPISDMPEDRAISLVNMFPKAGSVVTRKGWATHATGLGAAVESLLAWNGPASSKLFGAAGANIYEVSAAGAVGAAAVASLTNARFQHVNFGTSGGNFLWICNGADAPRHYDGTTWATPSITGITATQIINVTVHKRRLFFCLTGSLKFAYLSVESIAGAASLYDLAPIFDRGGYLMATGTWSTDGGAGPDDYAVFVTSEGQAAVYAGTDPSDATAWGLVGVYDVGQPIGRRCLMSYGSDLLMLSVHGAVSLSRVAARPKSDRQDASTTWTANIRDAYASASALYSTNYGWQAIEHAATQSLIINVPTTTGTVSEQFVANSLTGAWTRYTGLNAICWATRGTSIYFGRPGGKVAVAFTTNTDDGVKIPWIYRGAFIPMSRDRAQAQMKMVRPSLRAAGGINANIAVNVDYRDDSPDSPVPSSATTAGVWDTSLWNIAIWGSGAAITDNWTTVLAFGRTFSVHIIGQSNVETEILALNGLFERGRIL